MAERIVKSLGLDDAIDATQKLIGRQLRPGMNLIATNEAAGLELHVKAVEGKLLEFIITKVSGCPVDEVITVSHATRSETTCWKCGKDEQGNTHCWVIPCPVIVGPWEPSKVLKQALVLA